MSELSREGVDIIFNIVLFLIEGIDVDDRVIWRDYRRFGNGGMIESGSVSGMRSRGRGNHLDVISWRQIEVLFNCGDPCMIKFNGLLLSGKFCVPLVNPLGEFGKFRLSLLNRIK